MFITEFACCFSPFFHFFWADLLFVCSSCFKSDSVCHRDFNRSQLGTSLETSFGEKGFKFPNHTPPPTFVQQTLSTTNQLMMMSDMETAGGYCNLTYLESRHTSTTSIPGRYRRTEEPGCGDVVDVATIHIKYPKKTKNFEPSSMILNGKHLDQNANNVITSFLFSSSSLLTFFSSPYFSYS